MRYWNRYGKHHNMKKKTNQGRQKMAEDDKMRHYCSVLSPETLRRMRFLAEKALTSQSHLIQEGLWLLFQKEPYKSFLKMYGEKRS